MERRQGNRFDVRNVSGTLLFQTEATILNMSISGMAVRTTTPLRVRGSYSARLHHGSRVLPMAGTVVWCRLTSTRKTGSGDVVPVYEAGLRFESVISEKAEELVALLEESAVISLETRVYGRFQIETPQPVELAASYEFSVRQISTSGLLIEADLEPAEGAIFDLEVHCDGESFRAKGQVARTEPLADSPEGHYEIGVTFTSITPEDRRVLQGFITRQLG